MTWDLPQSVELDGKEYAIREKCDWRVAVDCLICYEDKSFSEKVRHATALAIFYPDYETIRDVNTAVQAMSAILDGRQADEAAKATPADNKPPIMSWKHDLPYIIPAVNRVLGYDVRTPGKYTHWWTFLSAYFEIGDCLYRDIIQIRSKLRSGKKLEDYERQFYNENREKVDFEELSDDDLAWLYA